MFNNRQKRNRARRVGNCPKYQAGRVALLLWTEKGAWGRIYVIFSGFQAVTDHMFGGWSLSGILPCFGVFGDLATIIWLIYYANWATLEKVHSNSGHKDKVLGYSYYKGRASDELENRRRKELQNDIAVVWFQTAVSMIHQKTQNKPEIPYSRRHSEKAQKAARETRAQT